MHNKVWDEIIYPLPNFNGATVEVWEWRSNFIPHFIMDVICNPCWDWSQTMLIKGAPEVSKIHMQLAYIHPIIYLCNSFVLCFVVVNSLRPRQNRRHFADDVFKCNFLNANVWILTKISLKFVPKGPINNIRTLVQIMAWRRTGDKPLSEPMMTKFNDAYMHHPASMS